MFQIKAPFPNPQTIIVLPSPEFGDGRARVNAMNLQRTVDGSVRTYIKRITNEKIGYSFKLSRAKGEEFRQFMLLYLPYQMEFVNHKDELWRVYITNDPTQLSFDSPSETCSVTLEAEGYKL